MKVRESPTSSLTIPICISFLKLCNVGKTPKSIRGDKSRSLYSTWWCVIYCSHMRRLFLERSRWLSPRGSLLKKERGTFICWRMSRHPFVPPLHSPVRGVAERRGVLCAVWLWRGCCALYAELRTARYWEPSGCRYSAESRSPPIAAPVASRSCSQTLASLALRPPALLAVSPDTSPGTPFLWKFLRNYVSTR